MSSGNTHRCSRQILAARKLNDIGSKPSPAKECAMPDSIEKAKHILEKIEERLQFAP
jgi:hypothetical protein